VVLASVVSVCSCFATAHAQPASFELSPFVGELYGGRVAPSPGPDPGGAGNQRLGDRAFGGLRLDARGYATDISDLDVGPICTTFPPAPPGGSVQPVPCVQDRSLRNAALSAGIVIRL